MARGKHATALFEVIHTARRLPKASPSGGIPTPKWWFKSKRKSNDGDAGGGDAKWSIFSSRSEPAPEPPPRIIERIIEKPVFIERPAPPPPMRIAGDSAVGVDRGAGEIKFNLSYGGAVAAGFVLLLVVAIAFLAGTRSPQLGFADEYRPTTQPSDGTALRTSGSGFLAAISPAGVAAPVASQTAPLQPQAKVPAASAAPKSATPPVAPTNTTPGNGARQVGMHYVIAQSYPDINIAKKACDVLAQAGIPCTVEPGPTGWALKSWYSVVSVKAFDHVQRNPELEAFKDAIETAGAKFATSRSFNRFEPKVYKWREDATPATH